MRRRGNKRFLGETTARLQRRLASFAAGCALLALCLLAASCGGAKQAPATAASSTKTSSGHQCRLSSKQKRAVATSLRDIHQMHRLELRTMKKWSENGTSAMEDATGKTLDAIEIVALPVDTKGRLLRLAKAASGLCGLCFQAFEAEEPAVTTRVGAGTECNAS